MVTPVAIEENDELIQYALLESGTSPYVCFLLPRFSSPSFFPHDRVVVDVFFVSLVDLMMREKEV